MKWSLYLGKYAGIKVFIHWTFSLLLLWIAVSGVRSGQSIEQIGWTILFILAVFLCVTLHEFGHALMAKKFNFKTKYITLLPIGGLAQMEKLPDDPKQELLVAIAGPMVNIVVAIFLGLMISDFTMELESLMTIGAHNFLIYLVTVNIILAVFNMIPAFPMDGGRVLRALLSFKLKREKATQVAASLGQFIAILFVFLGLFYNPFLVLIGIFIFLGAQAENSMVQTQSVLKGFAVKDVMMTEFSELQASDPLSRATQSLLDSQNTDFVIKDNDRFVGILSRNELIQGISTLGLDAHISEALSKEYHSLTMDQALEEVFPNMKVKGQGLMPVMNGDQLIGVVDSENVMEFILVREAMRNQEKHI
jgi:Zn-dependent protease